LFNAEQYNALLKSESWKWRTAEEKVATPNPILESLN